MESISRVYNKTKFRKQMHFSKFMTVSQIRQNTQIIAEHLNKSPIREKEYKLEGGEGKADHYQIRVQGQTYLSSAPINNYTSHKQDQRTLSPLTATQRNKHRHTNTQANKIHPLSSQFKQDAKNPYSLKQADRKNSQNNLHFKFKPTPSGMNKQLKDASENNKLAVPTSPIKGHLKNRTSSCQLEGVKLVKNLDNRVYSNYSDISPTKNNEALSILSKKDICNDVSKSKFLNNLNLEESFAPDLTKSQVGSPKCNNHRKHSDNVNVKKIPSFLSGSKANRKSFDSVEQKSKAGINIESFAILKQLGRGTFGNVVLAIEKKTHMLCAIKIMSKREIMKGNMVEQLVRELKIQMYLNHPNIVKVYGFFDDLLHFYIIIECALDGQMSEYIQKRTAPLKEDQASIWFYQACSAVSMMHSATIIHRDLKPENLMMHEGIIKICDFGWSVIRGSKLRSTFCGTPLYLCPQILIGDEYDESIDIWALGVILYEMLCKSNPFRITCRQQLVNILNSPIHYDESISISLDAQEVIQNCLSKRAIDRPNIRELLLYNFTLTGQAGDELKR